jgi:hypothetical protein
MLPLTVLRRLDYVLEPAKDKVLARLKGLQGGKGAKKEGVPDARAAHRTGL